MCGNGFQRFRHVCGRGRCDVRPVVDLDARVLLAGVGRHCVQLGREERDVHLEIRIARGFGNCLAEQVVFEAHSGRCEGLAVEHRLDEVGVLREDGVVLADERCHERRVQVHADLQAAATEAVGNGRHRSADDAPLRFKELRRERILELEAGLRRVAGDRKEAVALGLPGRFHRFQVDAFCSEVLCAERTAAAEHAAHAADERLGADAVEEGAVEAAVAEVAVVDRDDVGGVLRVGGAVEAEAFAGRQVVVGGHVAPQVDGGRIVAYLFGLRKYRQPDQHLDAFCVQVFADLPVDVLVDAPADDDLFHGNQAAHGIDAADDLLRRVIRLVPAAQRHLDDKRGLRLFLLLASCEGHQAKEKE